MRGSSEFKDNIKIQVALGSTSALKIKAVGIGFAQLGRPVEILSVDVKSGIQEQPEGFEQMFEGARSRAWAALAKRHHADIGIGLESGLVQVGAFHFDSTFAVIVDGTLQIAIGFGPGLHIPRWAVEEARESDLGVVVMKRGAKDKNPTAYFSDGTADRAETLAEAVKMAAIRYLFPHRNLK